MIQLYKNILPDDLVNDLLKYYESYEPIDYGNFTQVEIDTEHKLTNYMKDIVYKVTDHYFELHDKTNQHPEPFALEGFRIKRYEPNKGSFPWHTDASNIQNCTRFLALLFYLNTSEAGTKFEKTYVPAEKGSVVVFPPMWMFPHEGEMPKKEPKFIMSTYLHFMGVDKSRQV